MELSGFRKTDTLLRKLENAYTRALKSQTIHSASRIVEIQERLADIILSQSKRIHLIESKPDETAETR